MPEMKLDVVDAAELAELLQFLSQWLARDPARLGDSLAQFAGHPAYGGAPWPLFPLGCSCPSRWSGRVPSGPARRRCALEAVEKVVTAQRGIFCAVPLDA